MRHLLTIAALSLGTASYAQPVSIYCPDPDGVAELYRDDADRLAVSHAYRNNTAWWDSVAIDSALSNTFLNAMLAVYNSSSPERDTVVDILNIHQFPNPLLRTFIVSAASSTPWMLQLEQENIPTGEPAIDELIQQYGLTLTSFRAWPWETSTVVFNTPINVNLFAMSDLFRAVPSVYNAYPDNVFGDGNWITDSVHTGHVSLVYSFGWYDCQAGCGSRRYWEFNIFPDCSVEFMASWGPSLEMIHTGLPETDVEPWRIHPNPAADVLHIHPSTGLVGATRWEIRDATGRVVRHERMSSEAFPLNIDDLARGSYLLVLHSPAGSVAKRFIKQ